MGLGWVRGSRGLGRRGARRVVVVVYVLLKVEVLTRVFWGPSQLSGVIWFFMRLAKRGCGLACAISDIYGENEKPDKVLPFLITIIYRIFVRGETPHASLHRVA